MGFVIIEAPQGLHSVRPQRGCILITEAPGGCILIIEAPQWVVFILLNIEDPLGVVFLSLRPQRGLYSPYC